MVACDWIDCQEKPNAFNDYIISIFTQEDLSSQPTISGTSFPDIPPFSNSVEGIASLLSITIKATGPDNIPAYLIKKFSNGTCTNPNFDFPIISAPRASTRKVEGC